MIHSAEKCENHLFRLLLLLVIFIIGGCTEPAAEVEIPEHIAAMDSLIVIDPDTFTVEKMELVRDVEYGNSEEVLITTIAEFEVDDRGWVYIAEGKPGSGVIHVFEPDGSFLTSIGQFGRGPGDLLNTVEMDSRNGYLYNFNGHSGGSQISVFSIDDFAFEETILVRRDSMEDREELARLGPDFMHVQDSVFLMGFRRFTMTAEKPDEPYYMPYYHLSMEGRLIPGKKFEVRGPDLYYPERTDLPTIAHAKPFSRRSLVAVANDGTIYSAWTEDFLIEVRNPEGKYMRAIYRPYSKSRLFLSDFDYSRAEIGEMEEQLPTDTWPAMNAMLVDEQKRLWIATFTDDGLGGWIISDEGELLATFDWPGERTENRSLKYRKMIRNGYFYERVTDEETGVRSVVRYALVRENGERYE